MAAKQRDRSTNRNSHIVTRIDRTGKLRTETTRRDRGALDISLTTTRRGTTKIFFDETGRDGQFGYGAELELDGKQLRTLRILLDRHFNAIG